MLLRGEILVSRGLCLFLCLFLLTSFAYREANYCKISDRIVRSYIKEFAMPRRLMLTCHGGAMMDDIQEVSLSFLSFDTLNVDQARVLYVNMMEEFLRRINSHEKIRPFLHNYPFEVSNFDLTIGFDDANRKILGDGHVAQMFISRNYTLYYEAYNPETEEFYTLHKEDYREARKIVKNLKDNLLQSD